MPEPRTCHTPASTILSCTGIPRPGQVEALQRQCPEIVVSNRTGLGGRR